MTERHRYSVEFAADTVKITVDDKAPETFPLDRAGVIRAALDSLSWYAAHTKELDCDERLLGLLGRALFEFLFANHDRAEDPKQAVRSRFVLHCAESAVQLVLHFAETALRLAQLPWEFLWVPAAEGAEDGRQVAAMDNVKVTLSRALPTQRALRHVPGQLKVLHVTFAGTDQAPVRTGRLSTQLSKYGRDHPDKVSYTPLENAGWHSIKAKIAEVKPHIFHFSGHGENDALWLATAQDPDDVADLRGSRSLISFDAASEEYTRYRERIDKICELFDAHKPELVVLDACSSDTFSAAHQPMVAHALVGTVPAVIAMRYDIGDPAAVAFSTELYEQAIVQGRPLDEAVQAARYSLVPHGQKGFSFRAPGTPVLYLKESLSLCGPLVVAAPEPGGLRTSATEPPAAACPWCDAEGTYSPKATCCSTCGALFRCLDPACRARDPYPYPPELIGARMKRCRYCTTPLPAPDLEQHGAAQQTSPAPRPQPVAFGGWDVA